MNQATDFFDDFPAVTKTQWLERIAKDLKGRPLEELHWQLNQTLRVDPFGHADDQPVPPTPLNLVATGWKINEDIAASAPSAANRQALEALAFGAESVHFQIGEVAELPILLDKIYLDYIDLHFSGKAIVAGPAALLSALAQLAKEQGLPQKNLQGSLYYDPANTTAPIQDWRYAADLLQFAKTDFPGFRCLTVDGRSAFGGTEAVVDELVVLLRRGSIYLEQMAACGVDANRTAAQLQFCLYVGKSYFVEIAKLRAFKILWLNILKAWSAEPVYPVLDIRFAPETYTDDVFTNMIRASTMAMSAVLGGVDRLTVLPYDSEREAQAQYPQTFARRIARNVQHLLKLESGFGELADPAAGSFYIEKLTNQLAEAAWEKLNL